MLYFWPKSAVDIACGLRRIDIYSMKAPYTLEHWFLECARTEAVQKYIFGQMSMSKTFIGGAVCREFETEAPAAEEMLDWVVCNSEQFCFEMCLEWDVPWMWW